MKISMSLSLVVALLATPAVATSADNPTAAAKTFLVRLYSNYKDATFVPRLHPALYFDPSMTNKLVAIRNLEIKIGDAILDWDPVCTCQDPGGMRARVVEVRSSGPSSATARVTLTFLDGNQSHVGMKLVSVNGQWRIHDISSATVPSLSILLDKDLAEATRRRH